MILVKYIAKSGILSRRKSEDAIKYGEVTVNRIIKKDPTYSVEKDDIVFYKKNRISSVIEPVYIAIHKPNGCLTSKYDPNIKSLIFDFLPDPLKKIVDPIGRLDFNSSGLLLLTNDGNLIYRLSHPKFMIKKKYIVTASRTLDEDIIASIKRGIGLSDGVIRPDSLEWNPKYPQKVIITLHSGKYRVIRRLFEKMNIFVKKLQRVQFGPISLTHLMPGSWRFLKEKEVRSLKK